MQTPASIVEDSGFAAKHVSGHADRLERAVSPLDASLSQPPAALLLLSKNKEGFVPHPQWAHFRVLVSTSFQSALPDRPAPEPWDKGESMALHDGHGRYAYFGIGVVAADNWVDAHGRIRRIIMPNTGAVIQMQDVPSAGVASTGGHGGQLQGVDTGAPAPATPALALRKCRVVFAPSQAVLQWARALSLTRAVDAAGSASVLSAGALTEPATSPRAPGCHTGGHFVHTPPCPPALVADGAAAPLPEQCFASASGAAACVDQLMRALQPVERLRVVNFRTRSQGGASGAVCREIQYVPLPLPLQKLLLQERVVQHALMTQ